MASNNDHAHKTLHPGRITIDDSLVRRLVASQFPQWAHLAITPAAPQGWDNTTFRLGPNMSVRLPNAQDYTPQVAKEHRWLPVLAPQLPLRIPVPLALGTPNDEYPWNWSVYRWIEGDTTSIDHIADLNQFAASLARFLVALQNIDPSNGPPAGAHSFYRGAPLATYDADTRRAIVALRDDVDTDAASAVWEAALAAQWEGKSVWFHGDFAPGNLLIDDGQLRAVIDFGCSGVGDPACDMAIAWTLLLGQSREVFRTELRVDDRTWARGRGWVLWKALITLEESISGDPIQAREAQRVIKQVL